MKKSMVRQSILALSALIMLALTPITSNAQDVLSACANDVTKYCSQVKLGHGRLLACLYAHEDKISDACDLVIAEPADQLDWFFSEIRAAIEKCAPDIEKHCARVEAGKGRIYACLKQKHGELGSECKRIVNRVSARLAQ